ncbi:MAG: hypothetical protein IKI50_04105 [Clostridia bacterium]|nr:hypothetical protein [Clostridia bacterium]
MRESIVTIPLTEVLEPRDGCPVCRLRDMLEKRVVDYITGSALMEPDVRERTNREGFCLPHYRQMLAARNRLGVALILQSHLIEVEKQLFSGLPLPGRIDKKAVRGADKAGQTCFVCREIRQATDRLLNNLCLQWEQQAAFRRLWEEQPALCLPHFSAVCAAAEASLTKEHKKEFIAVSRRLTQATLQQLRQDIDSFTRLFDYRTTEQDAAGQAGARDAIERSIAYLTGRRP